MIRRVWDSIEYPNIPFWTEETNPINNVSLAPPWDVADAGMPVCPDVLFRCDGRMFAKCINDLSVRACVFRLYTADLRLKLWRNWESGNRHVER